MERASSLQRTPPTVFFWAPVLVLDAVLLLFLPHLPVVAAAAAAVSLYGLVLAHPPVALAVGATAGPLLYPLVSATGSDLPGFLAGRLLILLPLAGMVWTRFWRPEPHEEQARPAEGRPVRRSVLREPMVLFSVALLLLLVLGLLATPNHRYGLEKVVYFAGMNLTGFLGAAWILGPRAGEHARGVLGEPRWRERFVHFLRTVVVVQLVVVMVGVWFWFRIPQVGVTRLGFPGTHPIQFGEQMGLGLLALFVLWRLGRLRLIWSAPAAAAFAWGLYRAGSRGPLLAILAAGLFLFATGGGRGARGRRIVAGLAVLGAALLVAVRLTSESGGMLAPLAGREVSNAVRVFLLKTALGWIDDAGLLGIGTGGFPALLGLGDIRYFPHNLFLEVWIENGLVGLAVLAGFLLTVLQRGRRALLAVEARTEAWWLVRGIGAIFVFNLVEAQVAGDLYGNDWIWLAAGALLAAAPRHGLAGFDRSRWGGSGGRVGGLPAPGVSKDDPEDLGI